MKPSNTWLHKMNPKDNRAKSPHLGLRSGQRLGKYQRVRLLGTGGSCEVWKARDSVESIEVAVKIPLVGINGKRDKTSQPLVKFIKQALTLDPGDQRTTSSPVTMSFKGSPHSLAGYR